MVSICSTRCKRSISAFASGNETTLMRTLLKPCQAPGERGAAARGRDHRVPHLSGRAGDDHSRGRFPPTGRITREVTPARSDPKGPLGTFPVEVLAKPRLPRPWSPGLRDDRGSPAFTRSGNDVAPLLDLGGLIAHPRHDLGRLDLFSLQSSATVPVGFFGRPAAFRNFAETSASISGSGPGAKTAGSEGRSNGGAPSG
jgi:hypothetical protein